MSIGTTDREQFDRLAWNGIEFFALLPVVRQRELLAAITDPEALSLMHRFHADSIRSWRQGRSLLAKPAS